MRPPLIDARGIGVRRGRRRLLDNVSLTVDAGDFITIVGPNGAGKSTLLKCLLGLLAPDEGSVIRQPQLRAGYVPQRIMPAMTLPLRLGRFLTLNKRIADARLHDIAQLADIAHLLQTPLAALSGGEMQRAMLARALVDEPALLALDEPAQNLDVGGEIAFYGLLERICDSRAIAVVMVSHDLHFVMRRSRRVVCLYHHVCCSGAPQQVSQDPAFKTLFGDEMARLMAVYQHSHDHNHTHDAGAESESESASITPTAAS